MVIPWIYRRAGGRRRYNAERRNLACERQRKVLTVLVAGHSQIEIARALHLHKSTICRDVRFLGDLPSTVRAFAGMGPVSIKIKPNGWSFEFGYP